MNRDAIEPFSIYAYIAYIDLSYTREKIARCH